MSHIVIVVFFSFGLEVSYFKNYFAEIKACDSSPCLNGGNCSEAGGGYYTCQCSYGLGGKRCEGKNNLITFVKYFELHEK